MKYLACASRWRNPNNPSERKRSLCGYKQKLEVNLREVSNTITSIQKDYLMMETYEPMCLSLYRTDYGKKVWNEYEKRHNIKMNRKTMLCLLPRHDGLFRTITTLQSDIQIMESSNNKGKLITEEVAVKLKLPKEYVGKHFRIRKLTPRECFRLMDVGEENIDKLLNAKNEKGQQLISNSQLYKMAGNSIVVSCMEYMFRNLFIGVPEEEKGNQEPVQLKLF